MSLTVNDEQYVGTINAERNEIQFFPVGGYPIEGMEGALGNLPHSLITYYPNQNGNEVIRWYLAREVSGNVSLSYNLNLDPNSPNLPTGGEIATLPTNESAELTYTGTDGTNGDIDFPVPTVTIGSEPEQGGDDDEDDNPPVIIPDDDPTISIRKVWVEDTEEDRPDSILVEIYHDEELYDTVEVEERYRWRTS